MSNYPAGVRECGNCGSTYALICHCTNVKFRGCKGCGFDEDTEDMENGYCRKCVEFLDDMAA